MFSITNVYNVLFYNLFKLTAVGSGNADRGEVKRKLSLLLFRKAWTLQSTL